MADISMLALHYATQTAATVWARSTVAGPLTVECNGSAYTGDAVDPAIADGCGVCTVTGLVAGRSYAYTAKVGGTTIGTGTLRTMPADGATFSVGFGTCTMYSRDPLPLRALLDQPDMAMIALLGDQIYADEPKPSAATVNGETMRGLEYLTPTDQSVTMAELYRKYRAWWQLPSFAAARQAVPLAFVGDDHDHGCGNNWDGTLSAANANVAWASTLGQVSNLGAWCDTAFNAYSKGNPSLMPRYFSWRVNDALELFFVDGVAYRDAADGSGTTLLGPVQKAWLKAGISASTATFKVIMSGKNLYGTADDFSKYPAELAEMEAFFAGHASWAVPGGALWCSGDIHYPYVSGRAGYIYNICSSPLSSGNATPGNGYSALKAMWKVSGYSSSAAGYREVPFAAAYLRIVGHERMDVVIVDWAGRELTAVWSIYPGSNELVAPGVRQ